MSGTCRKRVGDVSRMCRGCVNFMSILCQSHVNSMSIVCRLRVASVLISIAVHPLFFCMHGSFIVMILVYFDGFVFGSTKNKH